MDRKITLATLTLLAVAVMASAQSAKVYFKPGGEYLYIGNGGTLEILAGGSLILDATSTLTISSAATVNLSSATLSGANSDSLMIGATNNTLTLKVDGTNVATFAGADAAGAADTTYTTTGAGTVTLGSATVGVAAVVGEDVSVTSNDDITITAGDDMTLNGGSAGSVINIGTNTHGNVINIGTDDTAADTINIGSAKDQTIVLGNLAIPTGAYPPATCTVGSIFLDTDETNDTNCTTTNDNSLCLCVATNTWVTLENN